jgi:hypothetical protein
VPAETKTRIATAAMPANNFSTTLRSEYESVGLFM